MNQTVGEKLPSPSSLGTFTVTPGAHYSLKLANSSARVARWAKANGGNLNVQLSAIGTAKERLMTTTFHTTVTNSQAKLEAPIGGSASWSRGGRICRT